MNFYFVSPDLDFTIELPLTPIGKSQLVRQILRLQSEGEDGGFKYRLAEEIAKVIPHATDWDLKGPTGAQLAYAKCLSRQLKCAIPEAALHSRSAMHSFLADARLLAAARKCNGE